MRRNSVRSVHKVVLSALISILALNAIPLRIGFYLLKTHAFVNKTLS